MLGKSMPLWDYRSSRVGTLFCPQEFAFQTGPHVPANFRKATVELGHATMPNDRSLDYHSRRA